ncbi:MAG TPA: hypothetical protein VG096_19850 [Bryobacteraceae bacterium]|nr:hypothetical protein [Bryobacteraceae bacterium]
MPRWLFIVLLSVAGFTQASGQVNVWIPHGPEGGRIGRPVIDPHNPGTIYASADGRLYRTTDAAGHWNDLGVPSVTILAVDPRNSSTLYGANNNTLYKSMDGGLTWSKPGPGLPGPCGPLSLSFVIDPGNTSTLYAGCQGTNSNGGGGLFKSTDGGATWNAASSGLPAVQASPNEPWPPNVHVNALAIDPVHPESRRALRHRMARERTLYAAIGANVSYGGGLFQSTDGAASWHAVNSGLPDSLYIDAVAVDPQNPNTLYVAGSTGVFRSTDGAASWTRAGNVSNVWSLAVDPLDSESVYALNDSGILKSTDGGGSWSVVSPEGTASDPFPWLVAWVVVTPGEGGLSTVYAGGNARGVFKSLDGGTTWTLATSGLFATSIYSLAIDPQNPHTVYAGVYVAGLYRSTDGAVSWSATGNLPGVSVFVLASDPLEPGTFYAGGPNGLYKSIDGGTGWVQLPVAPAFTDLAAPIFPLAVDARNPGTVYSGGFKSTDGGASWAKLALSPTALAIDPQDSGTLYAGTIAGAPGELSVVSISSGVRKSVDGGRSWSDVDTVSQSYGVSSLTVDPTNSSVVYAQTGKLDCSESYDCNSDYGDPNSNETKKGLGLFRSADGGATWAKLELPGDPFQFQLLGVDPQGRLYAQATAGLVRSMDGGATWIALPTAGLSSGVSVLAFDPQNPNHLFAGTGRGGVFEITLGQDE